MVLALQYYVTDMERAMSLARLLADLEPKFRDDVLLGLVCQPGTPFMSTVKDTIIHCSRKFPVEHVCSRFGAKGWADGTGQLWRGTMSHFYGKWQSGELRHDCIFTFDGCDGVPLHNNWIDLLMGEHDHTRKQGKSVTGVLTIDRFHQPHINGNLILDFVLFGAFPSLHDTPLGATRDNNNPTWDVYHAPVFMANASASSVVRNDWNSTGVTIDMMNRSAEHSIWLHGYKDHWLRTMARERLLGVLDGKPTGWSAIRQDLVLGKVLGGTLTVEEWEKMGRRAFRAEG
jgi:hypothetical protein